MRLVILSLILLLSACVSPRDSSSGRDLASDTPLDELDAKFESPWAGDANRESG